MYEYLTPKLLKDIIQENSNFLKKDVLFIGSIGDLLLETEYNKDALSNERYQSIYENVCRENEFYHIQEVSKSELLHNLFDDSEEIINLDEIVQRHDVPPHYTINYIGLKPNECTNFWEQDILEEMNRWYGY